MVSSARGGEHGEWRRSTKRRGAALGTSARWKPVIRAEPHTSGSVAVTYRCNCQLLKVDRTKAIELPRLVVQRMHYPLEVALVCVRRYAMYPLIEEMMAGRGVFVDHSTLHRWSMNMLSWRHWRERLAVPS